MISGAVEERYYTILSLITLSPFAMNFYSACVTLAGALLWHTAPAQIPPTGAGPAYPVKPLRMITAEAGGGSDFTTRLIAGPLAAALGQQVLVDNRGLLAAEIAARAPADGYSLLLSGATLWLQSFLREKVPYQITDFAPVSTATRAPNILVIHPQVPAKSVPALIALAKARPGELNYATSGNGNSVHLAGEMFRAMAGVNIVRVNYRGAARALTDLSAGQVQLMFGVPGSVTPHVKAGRLTALAVTSAEPSPLAPGLPVVAATVPGYESESNLAIFAPAGTPAAIVARLNDEITRVLRRPDMRDKFLASGSEPVASTPDALAALVRADMNKAGAIIKAAGIRTD
jgi:tripartite-type tricarboxylate transporter receptor subunit TctC